MPWRSYHATELMEKDLLGPRENRDDRQSRRIVCDDGDLSKGTGVKLVTGDNVAAGTASLQVEEHLVSDTDKETVKKRRLSKNQRQQRSFCYNCLLPSLP